MTYRGLAAVTVWVKLRFAALNLKKLVIHKWMLKSVKKDHP